MLTQAARVSVDLKYAVPPMPDMRPLCQVQKQK
jgi:hypothetical protein